MEAFETIAFVVRLVGDQDPQGIADLRSYIKYAL